MIKNSYTYIAVFDYSESNIAISFPDFPGCNSKASSTEDAVKFAKEVLGLHLWKLEQAHGEIPCSSTINEVKIEEGQVPILIEVFMPPIRDRIKTQFVKKTVSMPAWLAAKADADGVSYSKVLQNALIEYLEIPVDKTMI